MIFVKARVSQPFLELQHNLVVLDYRLICGTKQIESQGILLNNGVHTFHHTHQSSIVCML